MSCKSVTYHAHFLIVLDQLLDTCYCGHRFLREARGIFLGIEYVGCNDTGKIVHVHPRTGVLVNLMESGHPFEEVEQHLERVPVYLREEAAG